MVPYLMSSHPGSTLQDAVALAQYLNRLGRQPEQVQDFYPTPGTISTCMYYTGIDPTTMQRVYVAKTPHEKAMQRALLQWKRPDKRKLVIEALKAAGREDLIGYGPECLVRPDYSPRKPSGKGNPQSGGKAKAPAPVSSVCSQTNGALGPTLAPPAPEPAAPRAHTVVQLDCDPWGPSHEPTGP